MIIKKTKAINRPVMLQYTPPKIGSIVADTHIRVVLKHSKWLAILLFISHGFAALALTIAAIAWFWKLLLSGWLIWNLQRQFRQHVLFINRQLPLVFSLYDDTLLLDDQTAAKIDRIVYWHPLLLILCLRFADQRQEYLLILPDMLDVNTLRHLRVRVRHQ
jgi:hypothetical protein